MDEKIADRYPWLDAYLLGMPGAKSEFKAEWEWLRYLVCGKQFAAVCQPNEKHAVHRGRKMVLLKCDPILAELYRGQYPDVVPGFYSDKRTWNSVYLDGAVPDEVLKTMCKESYALVVKKLKKAEREALGQ